MQKGYRWGKGKKKNVINAVRDKLNHRVFAVLRDERLFDNNCLKSWHKPLKNYLQKIFVLVIENLTSVVVLLFPTFHRLAQRKLRQAKFLLTPRNMINIVIIQCADYILRNLFFNIIVNNKVFCWSFSCLINIIECHN